MGGLRKMQNKILEILRKEPNLLTNSITSRLENCHETLVTTRAVRNVLKKLQQAGLVDCKNATNYKVQKVWFLV